MIMKPHLTILALAVTAGLPWTAEAGSRTSASYAVSTDTVDAGGQKTTSASYSNDASMGGIAGISTVAAPSEVAKHGYIGQLYELTGVIVSASPTTVNETSTRQLNVAANLDDATTLALPATSVIWSVFTGPITSINASGLARLRAPCIKPRQPPCGQITRANLARSV